MTIWNAVLLGLVQGIAEILPISGSGHLSIINNLFKLSDVSEGHMLFGALLRLSTLIALVIVYWPELCAMVWELLSLANLGKLRKAVVVIGTCKDLRQHHKIRLGSVVRVQQRLYGGDILAGFGISLLLKRYYVELFIY